MSQVSTNIFCVLMAIRCILSFGAQKQMEVQAHKFPPEYSRIEILFRERKFLRPWGQKQYAEAQSALYFGNDILQQSPDGQERSPTPQGSAIKEEGFRWPGFPGEGTIPYVIDSSLESITDLIDQAIEQYHNQTCIRFVERKKEKDYITLIKGDGCSSSVGRQGGNQIVNLGRGCAYVGTIVHELGHAVGLYHEHQRMDRDDYIRIFFDNVESGQESNFEKTVSELNLTTFNYNSIMIYGEYAFSRDKENLKTMQALNESIRLIDPYDKPGLDNTDIEEVNKLYECEGFESE